MSESSDETRGLARRFFLLFRRMGLRFRLSLMFFSVVVISLSMVGYYGYVSASQAYREKATERVSSRASAVVGAIEDQLEHMPQSLRFAAHYHALKAFLYWQDLGVVDSARRWRSVTVDAYRSLLASRRDFSEIRFLDAQGQERIKVRYESSSREVQVKRGKDLLNQANADYFQKAMARGQDQIYLSFLRQGGDREDLEKRDIPIIRYAQPVIGDNQVKYGVVVIDLLADSFIDRVRQANQEDMTRYYLLSREGAYFYHPEDGRDSLRPPHVWHHDHAFQTDFPEIFPLFQDRFQGVVRRGGQIVSVQPVGLDPDDRERYWILLGMVAETDALQQVETFFSIFLAILAASVFIALLISRQFIHSIMQPLSAITRQLERLGYGEVVPENVPYLYGDEIGRMLKSSRLVMDNMALLTQRVDRIAAGEYSQLVKMLSARDLLGQAINNMTVALERNRQANERQAWRTRGLAELSQVLSGDQDRHDLAAQATAHICRTVAAGHGALFVLEQRPEKEGGREAGKEGGREAGKEVVSLDKPLALIGSFMFTERDALNNRFALGEGAVGQVAREKKALVLQTVRRSEGEIVTGTVQTTPLNLHVLPLLYESALLGVLEVAVMQRLDDNQRLFLDEAASVVSAALFSVLQRDRIADLLTVAEGTAHRAEKQSRQLQKINARMEEQQQQLREQTTELQQANALMEEQQQQMQQQTEELQQTNAQMEEQQQQLAQQSEALQRNNQSLTISQGEAEARARQLEEANRYKSDFLANMSHELRTPLNAIIVISKMMVKNEEETLDAETVKRADVIHRAGQDLLRMISDILDLSKIEAGRVEWALETFPAREIAEEMQSLFEATARDKKLAYLVEDLYQGTLTSDRHKLIQVLRNLLANAFKFTREGEVSLRIVTGSDPLRPVVFQVTDTGIGIPEDSREKIFEAFRQVDSSISRAFGGTGLGLSISKKFTELLDGTLTVESEPGQGSTFLLSLPQVLRLPSTASASSPPAETRSLAVSSNEKAGPRSDEAARTILVIDDDAVFVENLLLINRHEGLQTLVAESGQKGLEMAATHRPAGIVLDLGLPDMPGETVLGRLKTDPKLKDIPVYIISGHDKRLALMDQGAIGFLQKPASDHEIETAERALLEAVAPDKKTVLIVEGAALRRELVEAKIQAGGGRLVSVTSGSAALERAASGERFDLILVDHGLKGMTCLAFCQEWHALQPQTPMILYGADALDEEQLSLLHPYTDSVIQQAPQASQRIFRNIERFLHESVLEEAPSPSPSPVPVAGRSLAGRTILVADDDPRNLFVLTASLEQNGARVLKALNGKKALEQLRQGSVDLVFMDIMMPEMNGLEAIEAIRQDPALKHLAVIALTAKSLKEDRQECLDAGADDYLSKPVDYEMLINMAGAWVGKAS